MGGAENVYTFVFERARPDGYTGKVEEIPAIRSVGKSYREAMRKLLEQLTHESPAGYQVVVKYRYTFTR